MCVCVCVTSQQTIEIYFLTNNIKLINTSLCHIFWVILVIFQGPTQKDRSKKRNR